MNINRIRIAFISSLAFFSLFANAQNVPVGYWESILPYNTAVGVATDGTNLYTVCKQAFFTFSNSNGTINTYSKVDGMSDIGMACIGFDKTTSTAVLAYADGNIDLFKNNTFYNIPDFKLKNVSGAKNINSIYTENGYAYLCTTIGLFIIDLSNLSDSNSTTIPFSLLTKNEVIPVTSFSATDSFFYAATANGVYSINKFDPKYVDYQYWQRIDSTDSVINLATVKNKLYMANASQVFALSGGTIQPVYLADSGIQHIDAGNDELIIGEGSFTGGKLKLMDSAYNMVDSFDCTGASVQAVQLANNSIWIAQPFFGLKQRMKKTYLNSFSSFQPVGPQDPNSYDIYANNRSLYIAHGGFDEKYDVANNPAGISHFQNGKWNYYTRYIYQPFDTLLDFVALAKDETNNILYAGSFQDGLSIIGPNSYQLVNQNSLFEGSLANILNRDVVSLLLDPGNNLWITEMFADTQLYVKTADSNWYRFQVPGISRGGPLAIDASGQLWIVSDAGDGVAVYNTNNTISNPADDASYHLTTGVGSGNLPSNNGKCIAVDLNNNVWIGTDNGIGIVSNCAAPFTNSPPCDAEIPIVQYDQFAGYLFAGYNVYSIAVDGANRKWVGTDNGVWLLSPDASKIVYYFTIDNSPLPSNSIRKISIDQVTGDVYIGTDQGLICFRSTATEGGTTNQNVLVFPNPVPSGYSGSIAIKGLVANADVRITDISGHLVYKTTAFGGQAVWNGMDYTGRRPQSGVYLVFVTSTDGSQSYSGKIVFIQ